MKDPRMSPLFVADWEKATPAEQAKIIADLKPAPALKPGESFQVRDDGSFLKLKPGDPVPVVPVIITPDDPPKDEPKDVIDDPLVVIP